ncbi:hypothetical protein [Frigidibacter mobilis]|uniref:Uncharacterized protein n=1 Tax=Frigidibacter mobilis TaxID=1335048 RepID=A0A159Z2Y1_9RHOB|nr:hypothetical protein [Frigidibacter mobilis]AMY68470.1 hypothetical protein AKL17_1214 [Frigidibacter mobilis]
MAENPLYSSLIEQFEVPEAAVTALFTILFSVVLAALLGGTRLGKMVLPELSGRDRLAFGGASAIACLLLFAATWKGLFVDDELFWVAERKAMAALAQAKEEDEKKLTELCGTGSSPLTEANVKVSGRPIEPLLEYTRYRIVSRHGSCRESFSVEWTASEGHFLYLPSAGEVIDVQFVSRHNNHGYYQRPSGVALSSSVAIGQAFSSVSTSGWAKAKQPLKSRECGATVTLMARHLPIACLAKLQGS